MRTQVTLTYPVSQEKVLEIFGKEEFYRQRVADAIPAGSIPAGTGTTPQCQVEVSTTPTQIQATTLITVDPAGLQLPPVALKFLPATGLTLKLVEAWEVVSGVGTLQVEVGDMPVRAHAESRLLPLPAKEANAESYTTSATQRVSEVEVNVSIPFFGKKIESTIVEQLASVISAEENTFRKFI